MRKETRMDARDKLASALADLGYPGEFARLLADELRSDAAIERLAAYVRSARPQTMEEIVDEMLAIRDTFARWRERKISEYAEAKLTAFYNREREDEEED